jgi:TolB-like protein/class 3 adenylate cyclase/Flp pilus assembly protein TadD
MTQEGFKRKLTAILSADVESYSRLMRDDEEATIRTLTTYRSAMTDLIQQYRGRVVDAPGDNLLAEFTSVVDAVNCGVEIQREMAERNAELSEERRMKLRIGINLGDVVEEGERIYGDGVNIAARMERLAEAGGICISTTVYDSIVNKLGLEYEYLGKQTVKNIPEPIRTYRVLSLPGAAAHRVVQAKKTLGEKWRKAALAIAFIVFVGASVAAWHFYFRPSHPVVEVASVEKMAFPLPDKPSIAVLPFVNMSEDAKQEYFSDGITEDLITDLSKISGLFVIARNSVFTYKNNPVQIRQVAEELGVRYVLEGSVRRAGDQVRINAQLIDATTGGHLWAERYDGKMENVFALQDRITQKIVSALAVKLTAGEQEQTTRKETDNMAAFDAFLLGREHHLRQTPGDYAKALNYYEEAKMLDENYWRAYAGLAALYWSGSNLGKQYLNPKSLRTSHFGRARRAALLYLQMATKNPISLTHQVASEMNLYRRQHEEAIAEAERAIALEPNDASAHVIMATALIFADRSKEAVDFIKRAKRLDPHNPARYLFLLGLAQLCMGKSDEAAKLIERGFTYNPELRSYGAPLSVAYAHLGRIKEARVAMKNYLRTIPVGFLTPDLRLVMYFFPFKDREFADRFANGLLKAGLPGQHSEYYKVFKEHQLTGEEIRIVFFGRKYTRLDIYGNRDFINSTKDGKATYNHPLQYDVSGTISIEGNMLCGKFGSFPKECGPVFRNPEASPERKDEYLSINEYSIMPCSLVD